MNAITITTRQTPITVSRQEAILRLSRFTGPVAKSRPSHGPLPLACPHSRHRRALGG